MCLIETVQLAPELYCRTTASRSVRPLWSDKYALGRLWRAEVQEIFKPPSVGWLGKLNTVEKAIILMRKKEKEKSICKKRQFFLDYLNFIKAMVNATATKANE